MLHQLPHLLQHLKHPIAVPQPSVASDGLDRRPHPLLLLDLEARRANDHAGDQEEGLNGVAGLEGVEHGEGLVDGEGDSLVVLGRTAWWWGGVGEGSLEWCDGLGCCCCGGGVSFVHCVCA